MQMVSTLFWVSGRRHSLAGRGRPGRGSRHPPLCSCAAPSPPPPPPPAPAPSCCCPAAACNRGQVSTHYTLICTSAIIEAFLDNRVFRTVQLRTKLEHADCIDQLGLFKGGLTCQLQQGTGHDLSSIETQTAVTTNSPKCLCSDMFTGSVHQTVGKLCWAQCKHFHFPVLSGQGHNQKLETALMIPTIFTE